MPCLLVQAAVAQAWERGQRKLPCSEQNKRLALGSTWVNPHVSLLSGKSTPHVAIGAARFLVATEALLSSCWNTHVYLPQMKGCLQIRRLTLSNLQGNDRRVCLLVRLVREWKDSFKSTFAGCTIHLSICLMRHSGRSALVTQRFFRSKHVVC